MGYYKNEFRRFWNKKLLHTYPVREQNTTAVIK